MDNKFTDLEQTIVKEAAAALQAAGLNVQLNESSGSGRQCIADAEISVRYGSQHIEYCAEVKRNLRPATLGSVVQQLRARDGRPLLVSDYISQPMAERLQSLGLEFIDTVGNAWLNEPPLLVLVTGRRLQESADQKGQPTRRAFQASGLRVLFAMLCRPEMVDRPYREIARLAGVAHGTVGWVMAEMPKLGYLANYRKKRVLVKPDRLLREWAEAYARTLRPKLLLGKFYTERIDWWKKQDAMELGFYLGGEIAGARMTGNLKPSTVTFYGSDLNTRLITNFRLRRDPQGNVEIMKQFWNFGNSEPLTPAPLVYADLLATGDTRCIETAEIIYKKIVDGFECKE